MQIDVSPEARRYIASQGGDVYIYFDTAGRMGWRVQRVKLIRPPDRELRLHDHGGLRIWLDANFDAPSKLKIQRAFWRYGRLVVTGTGTGYGEGAFSGDGGSWPAHGHHSGGGDGGGHGGHGGQ